VAQAAERRHFASPRLQPGDLVHGIVKCRRHDRSFVPNGTYLGLAPLPPAEAGGYRNVAATRLSRQYFFHDIRGLFDVPSIDVEMSYHADTMRINRDSEDVTLFQRRQKIGRR